MRILYGVNGEGMGHAMRSAEVIKELSRNNKVAIIAGGKAADHLKKSNNLKKVAYLSFITKNGKINYLQTFFINLIKFPIFLIDFVSLLINSIHKRPKVIITDFEPLTSYTGLILRIPVISLDNQHIITDTYISYLKNPLSKFIYKILVYLMVPFPKKKIITTFFYPKISHKNTILVNPIVRKIISKQKSRIGQHILVYLSVKNDSLIKTLKKLKNNFVVYAKTNLKSAKNIKIRGFNEIQFANDLADAKAVICNASMAALTEALYLKKPVLCIPIKGQIEQEINGYCLQKNKFGQSANKLNKKIISDFLNNLKLYKSSLAKINYSNKIVFDSINNSINELTS